MRKYKSQVPGVLSSIHEVLSEKHTGKMGVPHKAVWERDLKWLVRLVLLLAFLMCFHHPFTSCTHFPLKYDIPLWLILSKDNTALINQAGKQTDQNRARHVSHSVPPLTGNVCRWKDQITKLIRILCSFLYYSHKMKINKERWISSATSILRQDNSRSKGELEQSQTLNKHFQYFSYSHSEAQNS